MRVGLFSILVCGQTTRMYCAYTKRSRCFVALTDGTDVGEVNFDFLPMVGHTLILENIDKVKKGSSFEFFTVKGVQITALYTPTTRETSLEPRDISSLDSAYTILVERVPTER